MVNKAKSKKTAKKAPAPKLVKKAKAKPATRQNSTQRPLLIVRPKIAKHSNKKWWIVATIVAVLVLLSAVPKTRYILPGYVMHKSLSIIVIDAKTGVRVSEAQVAIGTSLITTDQVGTATATDLKPGLTSLKISKPFYTDYSQNVNVTLFKRNAQLTITLQGLGSPAKLTVKNKLSGRALSGILIKTKSGALAKTGQDGVANIMLPSGITQEQATLSSSAVLDSLVTIQPVLDDHTNIFYVVPTGKVFYLSNARGVIDVVSSNLDGSEQAIVVPGTGLEDAASTELIASKDWKHVALKSNRDGTSKLFILDTKTNELTTIDQGYTLQIVGFSGDYFVYKTVNQSAPNWQPKRTVLKSYNTATKKPVTLVESSGEGGSVLDYAAMDIPEVYLIDNKVLFTEHWTASYYYGKRLANKKMSITAINPDGSDSKVLHDWQAGYDARISSRLNGANELFIHVELDGVLHSYWRYYGGVVTQNDSLADDFLNGAYQVYLDSPNGQNTLWSQKINGKNALFIGDRLAQKSKQVASLSDYKPYGWFTDDYILVSLGGNQLFVFGREGVRPGVVALKIGSYLTPTHDLHSYQEGYQK